MATQCACRALIFDDSENEAAGEDMIRYVIGSFSPERFDNGGPQRVRDKYLGDSFDIVKRFWAERLGSVAPLLAHPKFVPTKIWQDFEKMTAIPVLDLEQLGAQRFGLFLDPHTGIPLASASSQKVTASHAPLSFIEKELDRLGPLYLICFDQSHDRRSGLSRVEQRDSKRAALRARNITSFYYVSHAPFLFAAMDAEVLQIVHRRLVEGGIPRWRFEPQGTDH